MKIAFFTDTFLPNTNGVVSSTINHIKELSKRGHKILLFCIGSKYKRYFLSKNIEIIQYSGIILPTYKDYRFRLPTCWRTKRELERFKPDVIHLQTPFSMGLEGLITAKIMNLPVVTTHHTFFSDYIKYFFLVDLNVLRNLADYLVKLFFNRCNLVTTPSKALLLELKKTGVISKIIKIPNGISLREFKRKRNIKKERGWKKTVLYMGRVSYEKSIEIVINSMRIVQERNPEIKLIIVGEGPDLKNLKKLAKRLGVDVLFTGIKKGQELIDYIYAGDIFVTASKSENQPMSILEVMACGKSCIGVNSKGVPELIKNNKNGFIVEPDNYELMAKKIEELLDKNNVRRRFEKEAIKEVKKYLIENITKKWEIEYKNLSMRKFNN